MTTVRWCTVTILRRQTWVAAAIVWFDTSITALILVFLGGLRLFECLIFCKFTLRNPIDHGGDIRRKDR